MKRRIRNGSFGEEGLAETDRIFHNEICLFHNIPVGKTGREADMDAEGFCRGKTAEGRLSGRSGMPAADL